MQRRKFLRASAVLGALPATTLGLPGSSAIAGEGPRRELDDEDHAYVGSAEDPFPGCRVTFFKDNWAIMCVVEIDSRSRTVTRLGMPIFDCVDAVGRFTGVRETTGGMTVLLEHRRDGEVLVDEPWRAGDDLSVDGMPGMRWAELHKKTVEYDAAVLRGPRELLLRYRNEGLVPRDWVIWFGDLNGSHEGVEVS